MPQILTVTLNPALDMSSAVDKVVPEDKLRCDAPVYDPGGGGVNVARAAVRLGGQARAFVAVAGFRGEQFMDLLGREGVEPIAFRVEGETRLSLAVTDKETNKQFRFVMPGPAWSPEMAQSALDAVGAALPTGTFLVLSGSQPPGVPQDFPSGLAKVAHRREAKLILDTSGKPLEHLLEDGAEAPYVLRLDGAESAQLAGHGFGSVAELADFAGELVGRGVAENVVLAMGADGSVLVGPGGRWHAVTPPVPVASKVGAGDSFVGAFTLALSRGDAPEQALAHGVAAASAAVMSDATALCRAADYQKLVETVKLANI